MMESELSSSTTYSISKLMVSVIVICGKAENNHFNTSLAWQKFMCNIYLFYFVNQKKGQFDKWASRDDVWILWIGVKQTNIDNFP